MPELPAVEFTRRLIEENCFNLVIKRIEFPNGSEPDHLIFSDAAAKFIKNIKGHKVEEVGRWGKQLWILLSPKIVLLLHLGMTGFVKFKGIDRLLYESSPSNSKIKIENKDDEDHSDWPPRFNKFNVIFEDDACEMSFCDARRFSKIDILNDAYLINNIIFKPQSIIEKFKLGFDPLIAMPSLKEFRQLLQRDVKRKINMKALLMRQTFVAGVGNWMADDILMVAGILPNRPVSTLSSKEIHSLHKAIKDVTAISVAANADKLKFPRDWLFHIRWRHGNETLTGLKVRNEKIAGRSTFWIPELQK